MSYNMPPHMSILSRLISGIVLAVAIGSPVAAAPHVNVLKLSVTNPSDAARPHENITVSVADLKKIAPDFRAGDTIVTMTDAATLEEDARTVAAAELPSQADDLDGDGKYDEIAFQIPLAPKQTRIVSIA